MAVQVKCACMHCTVYMYKYMYAKQIALYVVQTLYFNFRFHIPTKLGQRRTCALKKIFENKLLCYFDTAC